MIESSGPGTVVLIIALVLSVPAMIWIGIIIVVGPRRYREWEERKRRGQLQPSLPG